MELFFYFRLIDNYDEKFFVEFVNIKINNLKYINKKYIKKAIEAQKCPSDLYSFLLNAILNEDKEQCYTSFFTSDDFGKKTLFYFSDNKITKEKLKNHLIFHTDDDIELMIKSFDNTRTIEVDYNKILNEII